MGFILVVALALVGLYVLLIGDSSTSQRLRTLFAIRLENYQALFGLGYVASGEISLISGAAGGAVDMLYVSLFYRVGIVGIAAYCLLIFGSWIGIKKENKQLYLAFLVSICLQALGESYLSSIMSFPSCFIWVLLSSLPLMSVQEEDEVLTP